MIVQSQRDMAGLLQIGRVVGSTLQTMIAHCRPGISTKELDAIGTELLRKAGARSAPIVTYKFPGTTCISINEEAAHGIPGERVVQEGDLVNIDVSAELGGYFADTGATVPMLPVTSLRQKVADTAQQALHKGLAAARAGNKVNEVGRAIETYVRAAGLQVIKDLPGHGVGKKLHEAPSVPCFYNPKLKDVLKEGMVLTIEPFVTARAQHIYTAKDGWTLLTKDHGPAAQYEHTVIITRAEPILITKV
jgi:methionyl aminopeptidase